MDYFPIFCQLKNRDCLLVGGNEIAEAKARLLLAAGARITVNALAVTDQFVSWLDHKQLKLIDTPFNAGLVKGKWLVIAATSDKLLNERIATIAETEHIFCNVVDTANLSSFIMPAIVDRSPLIVAISSSGQAPVLVRELRAKIELLLPNYLGQLAAYGALLRSKVKQYYQSVLTRRRFWEKFFNNARLARALAQNDPIQVTKLTQMLFDRVSYRQGEVVLVGAGPGDSGLLTLKGLQKIQHADIIFYDQLVSEDIMNLVRRDATRIFVGKRAGYPSISQEQINVMLVEHARQGKRVVRLKGGDPFIFGRGGEELEQLKIENIPFSVVPGITAASGCAAYSGIPLTHRDYTHSVRLITGHLKKGSRLDWQSLVSERQTLVFYMGLIAAKRIQTELLAHGMAATMPVAIIEAGTTHDQKVSLGKLESLDELAMQAHSPALIIIGAVIALRDKLNWFSGNKSD